MSTRVLLFIVPSETSEGAGNAGRAMRPQPRMQNKKHTSIVTTGSPEQPGIPRAMVLTVSFALSPVTGLYCHCHQQVPTCQLDASVGASGPHDFAVRLSTFVKHAAASTASRPTSVTIAKRPSEGRDGGVYKSDLGESRTDLFSAKALDWRNQASDLICLSGKERKSALCASHHLRHGRACPGHPRPTSVAPRTWMPGTSPGMTKGKRRNARRHFVGRITLSLIRALSPGQSKKPGSGRMTAPG